MFNSLFGVCGGGFVHPNTKRALSFLNSLFEVKTMLIGIPGGLSVRVAFFCICHTITTSRTSPEVQWCSEKCLIILQPFLATSCHQSETFYTIAQPTFRNIWLIYELSMLEDFEMEQKCVTNTCTKETEKKLKLTGIRLLLWWWWIMRPKELRFIKLFCLLSIFRPFFFCKANEKEGETALYFLL